MNTTENTATATNITAREMVKYVRDTRRYGSTYIHARIRNAVMGWKGVEGTIDGRGVKITFEGYGRSLQAGGHKYKSHARWTDTDTPVPSKLLSQIA